MESVWLCYAWEGLLSLVQWQCHQALCQMLYDHQPGERIPIPPCPEDMHECQKVWRLERPNEPNSMSRNHG